MEQLSDFSKVAERDLGKVRSVRFGKTMVNFSCLNNPYGHWHISYDRSQPPEHLRGAYTTFQDAHKDFTIYANSMDQKLGEIVRPDIENDMRKKYGQSNA